MKALQSKKEGVSVFSASEHNTKNRSKRFVLISILLIFVALVLLSVASAKYYTDTTAGIAYKFGQMLAHSLWVAIVSYLTWRFIFKKRAGIGLLCFSILFFSISSYQALTMITEVRQAKIAAEDVSSSIKEFTKHIFSGQSQETTHKNHSPQSYGKLNPLMVYFKNHLLLVKQDYLDFNNAMGKEHIENILIPDTLSNRSKIVDARRKLKKVNQLIDDYENLIQKRSIDVINQINSLKLEDNIKKKTVDGFHEGKREKDEYFKEYFRIERAFLAEVNKLLNFLLSRSGKYWVENGQIVFISDNDANRYNGDIQKIYRLAEEESKWFDKYQAAIVSKTQNFEKLFQ